MESGLVWSDGTGTGREGIHPAEKKGKGKMACFFICPAFLVFWYSTTFS
jgi:hypothetical protein